MHTLRPLLFSAFVAALLAAFLAVGGCATSSASDPATDQATLHAGTNTWLDAYNAGNADAIIALYAKDAVVMPPHAPAAKGHAAIRSFLVEDMAGAKAAGVKLVNGKSVAEVSGDLGWHSGSYTVADRSGTVVDSGHYMEAWRRTGGRWLIVQDIWNSDRPAE